MRGLTERRGGTHGGGEHPILRTMIALAAATGLYACDLGDDGDDCSVIAPALINGTAQPQEVELTMNERHAIVAIEDDSGTLICTGTVVGEGRVMTAASCLADGKHISARFYTGESMALEVVVTEQDGVVVLENSSQSLPPELNPLPLWGHVISSDWVGHTATVAGFGVTETKKSGELRFLDEPITKVTASTIEVDGMGSRGACDGDLGAPLITGNGSAPTVAGVLVQVSDSCKAIDTYERVDGVVDELNRLYGDDAGPYADYGGC